MQLLPFENNPETDDLQPDKNESFIIYDFVCNGALTKDTLIFFVASNFIIYRNNVTYAYFDIIIYDTSDILNIQILSMKT